LAAGSYNQNVKLWSLLKSDNPPGGGSNSRRKHNSSRRKHKRSNRKHSKRLMKKNSRKKRGTISKYRRFRNER
jgi:hypothetical protein